jgi:hypothetical protein
MPGAYFLININYTNKVREEAPIYSEVDETEYRKLTEEKRSKMFVEDDGMPKLYYNIS